jgi:transaldolase
LIAKEGVNISGIKAHIGEISKLINGPISVEVYATEYNQILKEAREYANWDKNIVIKIPCIQEGLRACKTLTLEGINTNITLIFTPLQALLAAKAGATYVSPFIGRIEDAGQDGISLISEIKTIFDNYNIKTLILSASFRSVKQIKEVALIGSDVATVSPELMSKILENIFTDKGLEDFLNAAKG